MKNVFILSLALAISFASFSQGHLHGSSYNIGFAYAQFDAASVSSINTSLGLNGYAPVSRQYLGWDIDLNVFFGRVVADLDFGFLAKRNTTVPQSRSTSSGSFSRLGVGYVAAAGKQLVVYPVAAFTPGSIDVHSHQESALTNDVSATNNFYALDFSLNLDWLFQPIRERRSILDESNGDLKFCDVISGKLSFSAGYCYSPWSSYWNDNNIDLSGTHNSNVNYVTDVVGVNNSSPISFYYVKVRIGFASLRRAPASN